MNFILNHKYSDGNTPIRPEEAEQLIPQISTTAELNEYEALNILQAQEWAFSTRTMKSVDPLEEHSVRTLHARMFDHVWKWAGTYRKHELNIGCDPHEILQRIPLLLGNAPYWLEHGTFPRRRVPPPLSSSDRFENSSVPQRKRTARAHDYRCPRHKTESSVHGKSPPQLHRSLDQRLIHPSPLKLGLF
jgi:hypothetical protein